MGPNEGKLLRNRDDFEKCLDESVEIALDAARVFLGNEDVLMFHNVVKDKLRVIWNNREHRLLDMMKHDEGGL